MTGADDEPPDDKPFVLPVTGELDLHAFAPRDIAGVVADYVDAAAEAGLGEVRLVHGRGRGVQRGRRQGISG